MEKLMENKSTLTDKEIRDKINEFFEANFQHLKETQGHVIDERMKERAYDQVMCYWKKNRELMEKVSRSEVKLSLPEQVTPGKGHSYTLEGSVDVIKMEDKNCLYDITTRSIEQIKGDITSFREQMNVFAHVWKCLDKKNSVDELGVVSTSLPKTVRDAIDSGNSETISKAISAWNPLVTLEYNEYEIEKMINNFGCVVDSIIAGEFDPPRVEHLNSMVPGANEIWGNHMCSACDIRYSCESYRKFKEEH